MEISPQNAQDDERLRNIVFERNLSFGNPASGRQLLFSGVDIIARDNIWVQGSSAYYGVQVARRGIEPAPTGVEVYNNTCYAAAITSGGTCVGFSGTSFAGAPSSSLAQNNITYYPGSSGHSTVVNNGSGNTVANNTAAPATNPGFINGSGSFTLASDFRPTTNYSGGTSVPVFDDFFGTPWGGTWDLGAIHP